MSKYIDADRLRVEIERRMLEDYNGEDSDQNETAQGVCAGILYLIDSLQQDKNVLDLCSQVWWEDRGWIMIPPNVTLEGIDSLLKQVRKKLPQYYKLRDIETGRTFMAEFSEIAGEWYEKGTGEAHSIASVEMVKEQQEPTCKTCGFHENNCPFIRGKLIPYPNKVCNDYTYSVMKEQEQHINIPERIFLWEDEIKEFLSGKRKTVQIGINQDLVRGLLTYVHYDVAREVVQPDVDLEKETKRWWREHLHLNPENQLWMDTHQSVSLARHFFELGLNARKEEEK